MKNKIKPIYLILIIILFTFIFTFFYLEGLKFDSIVKDDFYIFDAAKLNLKDLAKHTFIAPLNFVEVWEIYERPTTMLFLKIVNPILKYDPLKYTILSMYLLVLLNVIIFLFLYKHYKTPWCILAPLFFTTLPITTVNMIALWRRISILVGLLIVLTYFIFLKSFFIEKKNIKQIIFYNLLLILTTILAIKTKQNAVLILPIIFLFLHLTNPKQIKEYAPFLIVSFLYILNIFFQKTSSAISSRSELIKNVINILFKNPNTGFSKEPLSFISPLGNVLNVPGSLFGSLGFILSWLFLILFLIYLYRYLKHRKYASMNKKEIFLFFIFIWFVLEVLFLGTSYYSSVIRYLIWPMIPFTLLVFSISFAFFNKKSVKIIFITFMILLITTNAYHTLYSIRGGLMGKNIALSNAMEVLNNDLFGKSDFTTISDFYLENKILKPKDIIKSTMFVQGLNHHLFNKLNVTEIEKKTEKYGFFYIILFETETNLLNDLKVPIKLLGTFSQCDKGVYCDLKQYFGLTLNDPKLYLYKTQPITVKQKDNNFT